MTTRNRCDIAILGGGLAGGLIALALRRERPELAVRLIERADRLGGNHIWSFFESDLDDWGRALLDPAISRRWDGYEVRFPAHSRQLDMAYYSIRSDDFERAVRDALPEEEILTGAKVADAGADYAMLENDDRIEAGAVVDCRGAGDLTALNCGWQKFVGIEIELPEPHGLERPIVMDATVEQIDGYRFVYSLPFGKRRIFVEDTYYSNGPDLDAQSIEQRALSYAEAQGWMGGTVIHREKGVLPVTMPGGDLEAYLASGGNTAKAGVRAGLFHPVTGYSLPDAVRVARLVAQAESLSGPALHNLLENHARRRWRATKFYRMLDAMLFEGAGTEDRYKILERFYTLRPALISRFYAGQSTWADKLRIVSGKPPIPVSRGIKALIGARKRVQG